MNLNNTSFSNANSPDASFRRLILKRIAIGFSVIMIFGTVVRHVVSAMPLYILISNGFIACLFLLTVWLGRFRIKPLYMAMPIGLGLIINLTNAGFLAGGVNAPVFALVPLLPVMGFCFGGRALGLISLAVSFALVIFFAVAEHFHLTAPLLDPTTLTMQRASLMLFMIAASYVTGNTYETSRYYAEQRVVEVSHLASLGTMAGGLAHEINNPLTVVLASAHQLEKMVASDQIDPKTLNGVSRRLSANTHRIAKIISMLMMYSRDESNSPLVPTSLGQVVQNALDLCGERFRNAAVELRVANIPENAIIMARMGHAVEALLNLFNNAFDAVKDSKEPWIAIDCAIKPSTIELSVTDSGLGIDSQLHKKIFAPFFTTKDVGQGTGMGLSLSASIMNQHGGSIALDIKSKHTRFVLSFVRSPESC